jgi:hypothetical protein
MRKNKFIPTQIAKLLKEFDLAKKGDTEIRVVDVNGREMYFKTLKNFKGKYSNEIELGDVAKGIYFLQVFQNGKQMVKKLITE